MNHLPSAGIVEFDLHGLNVYQAATLIDSRLKSASKSCYRLRLIHGFHAGTALRDMIRSRYKKNPRVLRVEFGLNGGETDLVLREWTNGGLIL